MQIDHLTLQSLSLDVSEYGRQLTAMLFASPDMRRGWEKACSFAAGGETRALRVHLILDPGDSFLHSLRWETLQDPSQQRPIALSERTLLSRTLSTPDLISIDQLSSGRPRALVVIANPQNLSTYGLAPIDVAGELSVISQALGKTPTTIIGSHAAAHRRPASLEVIVSELSKKENYTILYLVCHGRLRNDEPYLVLEQADGTCAYEPIGTIVHGISDLQHRPLLVVITACQSAGESHTETVLTALGPQLAQAGVRAVLAMHGLISMAAVRQLMPRFFQELRKTGQVDLALATARRGLRNTHEWWKPILFLRARDGRLWPKAGRILRAAALASTAVTLLALVIAFAVFLARPQAPPTMTGGINVAVLPLDADPLTPDIPESQRLTYTQQIVDVMRTSLGSGLDETGGLRFQVWGPQELAQVPLGGADLSLLAQRINATMIIYGRVSEDKQRQGQLSLQLFVAGTETDDAAELLGDYYVGEPVTYTAPLTTGSADDITAQRVLTRLETITSLILGLRELSEPSGAMNAQLAEQYFIQAQERMHLDTMVQSQPPRCPPGFEPRKPTVSVPNPRAEATVQVLLGNVAQRIKAYDQALVHFAEAQALDCNYGRAHLGVAIALIGQTMNAYTIDQLRDSATAQDTYQSLLHQAEEAFVWAQQADHPERAFFTERLASGRGRLQLALARSSTDNQSWLSAAQREFSVVIQAYETAQPDIQKRRFLRAMAASAYADRALAAGLAGNGKQALSDYRRAVEVEKTLGRSADPTRLTGWQIMIADLALQQEGCQSGLRTIQEALDLAVDPELIERAEKWREQTQSQCQQA